MRRSSLLLASPVISLGSRAFLSRPLVATPATNTCCQLSIPLDRSPLPSRSLSLYPHCLHELTRHAAMANSASGLAVNDECKVKFRELKARRSFRFIVFRIDDKDMEIKVDRLGDPNQGYGDFTDSLPADECRYAIYDLDFTTVENCQKSKIFFFSWSPDTARTRSKMLYASSKDRFRRELDGIQCEIQATDPSEMSLDIVKSRTN